MKNITRMRKFLHMNGRQSHLLLPLNYKQATHRPLRPHPTHRQQHLPADLRGYFIVAFFGILCVVLLLFLYLAFYFIIFRLKYFWFSFLLPFYRKYASEKSETEKIYKSTPRALWWERAPEN